MKNLRFKTSYKELKKIAPMAPIRGSTEEIRTALRVRHCRKVTKIRAQQQASGGLIEFPFGLFIDGKRIKTVCMTEEEANHRNHEIGDASMVWRRCGY